MSLRRHHAVLCVALLLSIVPLQRLLQLVRDEAEPHCDTAAVEKAVGQCRPGARETFGSLHKALSAVDSPQQELQPLWHSLVSSNSNIRVVYVIVRVDFPGPSGVVLVEPPHVAVAGLAAGKTVLVWGLGRDGCTSHSCPSLEAHSALADADESSCLHVHAASDVSFSLWCPPERTAALYFNSWASAVEALESVEAPCLLAGSAMIVLHGGASWLRQEPPRGSRQKHKRPSAYAFHVPPMTYWRDKEARRLTCDAGGHGSAALSAAELRRVLNILDPAGAWALTYATPLHGGVWVYASAAGRTSSGGSGGPMTAFDTAGMMHSNVAAVLQHAGTHPLEVPSESYPRRCLQAWPSTPSRQGLPAVSAGKRWASVVCASYDADQDVVFTAAAAWHRNLFLLAMSSPSIAAVTSFMPGFLLALRTELRHGTRHKHTACVECRQPKLFLWGCSLPIFVTTVHAALSAGVQEVQLMEFSSSNYDSTCSMLKHKLALVGNFLTLASSLQSAEGVVVAVVSQFRRAVQHARGNAVDPLPSAVQSLVLLGEVGNDLKELLHMESFGMLPGNSKEGVHVFRRAGS